MNEILNYFGISEDDFSDDFDNEFYFKETNYDLEMLKNEIKQNAGRTKEGIH